MHYSHSSHETFWRRNSYSDKCGRRLARGLQSRRFHDSQGTIIFTPKNLLELRITYSCPVYVDSTRLLVKMMTPSGPDFHPLAMPTIRGSKKMPKKLRPKWEKVHSS